MNVLSLFDGMSCTQIALKNLGIKVDKYYASEIDKYAIKVARENFPETIHLGDIKDITGSDFIYDIDLIVAGSPCQGFSFAGKQLAFDDPRSALFFEFVRLLREVKPKYFLLENVRMKKEHMDVISQQVSDIYPECNNGSLFGIEPIKINSALVSAQSRNRLYWTNIPNIEQPKDLGIVLRDILEPSEDWGERPQYLKNEFAGRERGSLVKDIDEKSACLNATMYKGQISSYVKKRADEDLKKMTTKDGKAFVLTASYQGAASWNSIERKQRTMVPTYNTPKKVGMNIEEVKVRKHEVDIKGLQSLLRSMKKQSGKTNKQIATETDMPITKVEHWFRTDTSFAIPTDDIWFSLKNILGIETNDFDKQIMEFEYKDGVYETKQRVYSEDGKSPTLTSSNKEQYIETYDTPKQVGTAADLKGYDIIKRVYSEDGKSPTLTTMGGGHREPKVAVTSYREVRTKEAKEERKRIRKETGKDHTPFRAKELVPREDGKVGTLTPSLNKDHTISVKGGALRARSKNKEGKNVEWKKTKPQQMLELRKDDKSNSLTSSTKDSLAVKEEELTWRKLTPLECERLQTVPDNYTAAVSNTQRYKMLGNGFTVSVIEHILKNMEI